MGRYYYSKKEEADSLKKIQIWWLKRNNYLEKGYWKSGGIKWTNSWSGNESSISFYINLLEEEKYLQLVYTQTNNSNGEKQDFDYKISLVTTPCYFGGIRYWFTCPWYTNGKYCGRRVGVLYLGGKYFACRHCYDLSYESRNENRRFKDYGLFYVLGNRKRIEDLEQKIKRKTYRGKLTRKQKALNKLYAREFPYDVDIYRKRY